MREVAPLLALSTLAAVLLAPLPAAANGRFPEANQIFFSAEDPNPVLVRLSFGALISHDRGITFDWICEKAIGVTGDDDPMYAVTKSGAIVASTFGGVARSANRGCTWSFAGGDLAKKVFVDLAANPKDANDIFVFSAMFERRDDAGRAVSALRLWETRDEGRTFAPLPGKIDPIFFGYTIDVAPTDPDRLYISASRDLGAASTGALLVSTDHGKTWDDADIPLLPGESSFYIAAIDPNDADRVYLRTWAGNTFASRLLLFERGHGVRHLFTGAGALPGFALSPDGSRVYVGGLRDGVLAANTADFVFRARSPVGVQCLALSADGLWACATERDGFLVGLSTDDGATFAPRTTFCTIRGPLACTTTCAAVWPAQRDALGCGPDAGPMPEPADAGAPALPMAPPRFEPGGGGCQTAPASGVAGLLGLSLVLAALHRRRSR